MSDATHGNKAQGRKSESRYVTPDCEEIEYLISKDPKGRSADLLFRDAGIASGSRLLKAWKNGQRAMRSIIELLAKELVGCESVDQIIVPAIQTPNITNFDCPVVQCGDLIFEALFSSQFRKAAFLVGGFEKLEMSDFILHHFRRQVSELNITLPQLGTKLREFSRIGWLRESDSPDGPQFFLREWHPRQCKTHNRNRITIERNAILYAFYLSKAHEDDGAVREFQDIIVHQEKILAKLREAIKALLREPTIENAFKVIKLDCQFHQGWGGYDTSTISLLAIGIGGHLQLICRLLTLEFYLERKGQPLPEDFSALPELVTGFHEELSAIFQKFLVATSTQSNFSIRSVLRAAKEHAKPGYEYILEADRLLEYYRNLEN